MRVFKTILLVVLMTLSQAMVAQTSPIPMLERAANQIISVLKENKARLKSNPEIIYKAVEENLVPNVDVEGMSRSVLGRQAWSKATEVERIQFSKAFTRLVIRTYSSPLAQYSDETVQFLPLRGSLNNRFIRVNSVIVRSAGQNIPLSYSLVSKDGKWKIYDISVEGVSLLQSFRSQFAQALQHSSISQVIKEMQQKQIKKAS
ncbi:TPA: MlaC/ttg2D family ABC transporter substrate-binding protein [Legionella pneumophila subsp. raphaeli]|uniref:MlaC/ttg2D family ABC transporter substrate-binding protein n=1 Tax=Legionella pneumophila TaxID=446 RepID=UPI000787CDE0|nr:ABC transporter substrate-binding protein [Legionella pneumophila]HAU1190800.1 ABC transporter substrate-binding protein [Legionella pneumophila]HEN5653486.1 ABC transporter substrate-binding protein [Legionella pneumophila]HEN5663202.1 ABC transporter substrate-binding protein [Legionella pneumophila]